MSDVSTEIRARIKLSIAAVAYEIYDDSIMTDSEFDTLSLSIRPSMATGNDVIDRFFREEFDPNTGSWCRKHPGLKRLEELYKQYYERES